MKQEKFPKCGCLRVTAPVHTTTKSAFKYIVDPQCELGHNKLYGGWRWLSTGKRMTGEEESMVNVPKGQYP